MDDDSKKMLDVISKHIIQQLPRGIFLSVGGDTPNTMTIGWGSLGNYWGCSVFTAPIRKQRFTYPLLLKEKSFILSVPDNDMARELVLAGTLSGRDGNKFERIGLETKPGRVVNAPAITAAKWQVECVVRAETDMLYDRTDRAIAEKMYAAGDFHTLFMAEIVACYQKDGVSAPEQSGAAQRTCLRE
ncbi:MAG: flavin reductase family protein [Oscillospiraceae bacterium]|nr:flavin reductase family protein [Oscillospiraceae bacterium]